MRQLVNLNKTNTNWKSCRQDAVVRLIESSDFILVSVTENGFQNDDADFSQSEINASLWKPTLKSPNLFDILTQSHL